MHGPSEVAGQNSYAVLGLREIGVDAETVVFTPHPFGYAYDRSLGVDKSNKLLFPVNALKLGAFSLRACARYDVFHFHFGNTICKGHDLGLYDKLGKKCFFEFHGSDIRDTRYCIGFAGAELGYESIKTEKSRTRIAKLCSKADGIVLHDDELIPFLPDAHPPVYVVPLRLDIGKFTPAYPDLDHTGTVKVVHAPSRRAGKGTSFVIDAVDHLKQAGLDIELILVEGKTQQEALAIYSEADIIVDQLLIGTYGVFAIESMALGKPVITYIADEMKPLLPEELPIVSATPYSITKVLKDLAGSARMRHDLGVAGRRYAEDYHDYRNIAYMLKDMYEGSLSPLSGREAFAYVKAIAERKRDKADV